jgi:putative transposase
MRNVPAIPDFGQSCSIVREITELIVRMARENSGWGYDRIAVAVQNLGHRVSNQAVGNILRPSGIAPGPERSQQTNWADFIRAHMAVLSGMDFFTAEVLTWLGLSAYYVLFFLHLKSRRVTLAGITQHPTEGWMVQTGPQRCRCNRWRFAPSALCFA